MCILTIKILAIIVPEKTVTQKKILRNYGITELRDYGQTKSSIARLFQSGAITIKETIIFTWFFFKQQIKTGSKEVSKTRDFSVKKGINGIHIGVYRMVHIKEDSKVLQLDL